MRRRQAHRDVALALVLALTAAAACKRRAEQAGPRQPPPLAVPMLGEVLVQHMGESRDVPEAVVFDDKGMTAAARRQLESAKVFAEGSASATQALPPKANVLVGYAIENVWADGKGLARAMVKLRVGIKPHQAADPDWGEDVEATGEIPYETASPDEAPARAFTTLVSRMVTDMVGDYISRQQLRRAEPQRLVEIISAGPSSLREDAIRIAGERQIKDASGPLLKLLNDEEETARDAALGALVQMRERRAVGVLAESRSMRDTREMRKILTAIAILGGTEARDYLRFVMDAHEDEEIRTLAQEALARLDRGGRE